MLQEFAGRDGVFSTAAALFADAFFPLHDFMCVCIFSGLNDFPHCLHNNIRQPTGISTFEMLSTKWLFVAKSFFWKKNSNGQKKLKHGRWLEYEPLWILIMKIKNKMEINLSTYEQLGVATGLKAADAAFKLANSPFFFKPSVPSKLILHPNSPSTNK